ncbi:aminotransferase class V-fold PLP-dependent enzyme, partial [Escherichia coli]|nr:aminotransferase class V-fold PLP-dependent enzyme [Escherichia coli]
IGRVTRAAGIPYFIDAAQALGQLPVDVSAIGCDMLKGSGRKFLRGPRGAAILYLRKAFLETLEPAYLDVLSSTWGEDGPHMRTDAQRFETSEKPIALLLG